MTRSITLSVTVPTLGLSHPILEQDCVKIEWQVKEISKFHLDNLRNAS
jgi:hypothetical protein